MGKNEDILQVEEAAKTVDKREYLLTEFEKTRNQTNEILEPLEIEDYVVQTEAYMSPPRWHLGHTTWFYEQLLRTYYKDKFKPYETDYAFYFNSYYLTFGKLFNKARRGTLSRPTVKQTKEYVRFINEQVRDFFSDFSVDITEEINRNFELAFNHEYQHQELLVYDVQHLLQDEYKPVNFKRYLPKKNGKSLKPQMIKIPAGMYEMGFDKNKWKGLFAYDVEMPAHKVYINEYMIDKYPVTNREFLEFMNDGGYTNFRFWLSEGWGEVKANDWTCPLYWIKEDNGKWFKYDFRGRIDIEDILDEPVSHISYFEAAAYAKWAGKRLPTEAEWEKAASWDEDKGERRLFPWGDFEPNESNCNLLGFGKWSTTRVDEYEEGKSYYGLYQLCGDTWEWTSSEFMPYPGFRSGFEEYNDKWFGNQKVLRGGSFGTPVKQVKNTYRNFFKCNERWLISGFRCAKDIE